jgi:ABC-type dipeptide/oligopeptide/nickel transport system ATPase subunit
VKRLLFPSLFIGLLIALQLAFGQVSLSNPRTPKSQVEDRLPDGTSRTMAMVKDDQERSLEDIAKIREAVDEMEKELSKSEFLVSLTALKRAEEIEDLAKDIQGRLKRRR